MPLSRVGSVSNVQLGNIRKRANTLKHERTAKLVTEALSSSSLANLRMPVGFDNLNNVEALVKTKYIEKPNIPESTDLEKSKENVTFNGEVKVIKKKR